MHGLGRANADQDSQHFHTGGPLRHRWIEAVTALLDSRKVERRRVGDRLKEVGVFGVLVIPWNGRVLPRVQARDCLRKHEIGIKVRIVRATAVPSPPTCIESELRQVC